MKVGKPVEIILDGKKYLLEEGDEITLNEGIISGIAKSMLRKLVPFIEKLPEFGQETWQRIMKDPRADGLRKKLGQRKHQQQFFDLFG